MSRFRPIWLLYVGAAVVAVAYVLALVMLQTNDPADGTFSNAEVVLGVIAMFSVLCAFVLAFVVAARSGAE